MLYIHEQCMADGIFSNDNTSQQYCLSEDCVHLNNTSQYIKIATSTFGVRNTITPTSFEILFEFFHQH